MCIGNHQRTHLQKQNPHLEEFASQEASSRKPSCEASGSYHLLWAEKSPAPPTPCTPLSSFQALHPQNPWTRGAGLGA